MQVGWRDPSLKLEHGVYDVTVVASTGGDVFSKTFALSYLTANFSEFLLTR